MPRRPDPDLRSRLLAAATAAFAERGFAGATLDHIAAAAGVTKGGLYLHFPGKEALFFAVFDHWRQERRRRLAVPDRSARGAANHLQSFLTEYLRFHRREPAATHLRRVLATELRGRFTAALREDERQELRWLRAQLRELLVAGNQDGTLAAEDPALGSFVLAAALLGALEQWHVAPGDVEAFGREEALARALVGRYATGTAGSPAGSPRSEYDFRDRPSA
jgi:AcrR family transcriptional regulator